ncbi:PH domain-containing protein [filamentous cyanobacterium LEGE 11480]|uniref:PH domain-containing protein n=1 Tax=Romeriopsis navalis LEGE 11480 TaxID=2777977 RepID=A0A928VKT8_9CYAN|nr:PH domain-containing protein [Romeriopsis navalis]MBE9028375.1 PH domain-containing protein [Romeriopsis navalis LEGE 11480]
MINSLKKIANLTEERPGTGLKRYEFLLVQGEEVLAEYKSVRDRLVLTDRRIINIDIQGIRGKKSDYLVIPYTKISGFSIETAGTFDLDAEFKLWVSGMGELEFEFLKGTDVRKIAQILSACML